MNLERVAIRALEPLLREAIDTHKWFYVAYQGIWFSPKEIQEQWKNGQFIWGPSNWRLRDPQEKLDELKRIAENANRSVFFFERRMEKND